MTGTRKARQALAVAWCTKAFGEDHARNVMQRGLRSLEENIELYQACGGDEELAHRLVAHVFQNPPGSPKQELGGVGLTLLVLAEALDFDADECEDLELERVLSKSLAHFRERNEVKNRAGFDVTHQTGKCDPTPSSVFGRNALPFPTQRDPWQDPDAPGFIKDDMPGR